MSIDGFVNYLKHEKRYSERTLVSYSKDLDQFSTFISENYPDIELRDISNKHIRNWVVSMVRNKKYTPRSVRRKVSALNSFFNFQMKRNGLAKNPAIDLPPMKLPKRVPQYLSARSMEDIEKALSKMEDTLPDLRTFLIMELLYTTGMRRQELINLAWGDVNKEQKNIRILGKGNKERLVPISDQMIKDLARYKKKVIEAFECLPHNIFVTDKGKKVYPKYVYNIVRSYLTEYSSLDKRSPHILRHTFATHLLNNGADLNDIKELLGHSSLASTQVYTHNSIEELKNIYKLAHPKS